MYTPLFAPVAVPILVGLLKELVGWVKRRKARRRQGQGEQENEVVKLHREVASQSSVPPDETPKRVEQDTGESEVSVGSPDVTPGVHASKGRTLRARTRRQVADGAG